MSTPAVSFIVPCYNASRYVPEDDRTEPASVFRATPDGIERVMGPGVRIGDVTVYELRNWSTGVLNDLRWRMFTHLQRLAMNFFARSQAAKD